MIERRRSGAPPSNELFLREVEGRPVGGNGKGGTAPLSDGDAIIVGTAFSLFVFKVRVGSQASPPA